VVALAYSLCALIWSTTWYAIRLCFYQPDRGGFPPITAAAVRFAIATAVLWGLLAVGLGRPLPRGRKHHLALAAAGVSSGLGYAAVYLGETEVSGGTAAVLFAMMPFFVAFFASLSGTEQPTRADLLGALVGFAGVAVLGSDTFDLGGWDRLGGVGWVLLSVTLSALNAVILKRYSGGISPIAINAHFSAYGCGVLWAVAFLTERGAPLKVTWPTLGAVLYLALVGTVVAFVSYFYLLRHASLMLAASLVFVEPILALVIDVAADDAQMGARGYFGAMLVLAATVVTVHAARLRAATARALDLPPP
jgi:drug/metabolite transporter (DMT)-like permease